jgi:hypothetical protein
MAHCGIVRQVDLSGLPREYERSPAHRGICYVVYVKKKGKPKLTGRSSFGSLIVATLEIKIRPLVGADWQVWAGTQPER